MHIRLAVTDDLAALPDVYKAARAFMRKTGNHKQWTDSYPTEEVLLRDIQNKQLYVVTADERIVAAFALIAGADPTYSVIEHGTWISDTPYLTIHRLASDGTCHGIAAFVFRACQDNCSHLRVDTHKDNHVMQRVIRQNGFHYCGIIHIADGTPRLAFEWVASSNTKK